MCKDEHHSSIKVKCQELINSGIVQGLTDCLQWVKRMLGGLMIAGLEKSGMVVAQADGGWPPTNCQGQVIAYDTAMYSYDAGALAMMIRQLQTNRRAEEKTS